jgi:hypothetical protein
MGLRGFWNRLDWSYRHEASGKARERLARSNAMVFIIVVAALLGSTGVIWAQLQIIFNNSNVYAVENGPMQPTVFGVGAPVRMIRITTYHWNYGRGARPGTIGLRSSSGEIFGPWQALGQPGQGGVPNANWVATPGIVLPAGTYTVLDSDPSTWSHNAASGGVGMAWAEGYFD